MSAGTAMLGTCPYLAAPCRACCGYLVSGRCRFAGGPAPMAECRPASPRAWYLGALDALSREGARR